MVSPERVMAYGKIEDKLSHHWRLFLHHLLHHTTGQAKEALNLMICVTVTQLVVQ